jgi:hypothetical protein
MIKGLLKILDRKAAGSNAVMVGDCANMISHFTALLNPNIKISKLVKGKSGMGKKGGNEILTVSILSFIFL